MNKTNFKKLTIISAAALVAVSAVALVSSLGDEGTTLTKGAEVTHDASCLFNHYDAVERSFSTHGSKEYWACCTHPGSFVLEKPTWEDNITDKGALTGKAFDEMTSDDDRYVPSISEGDVIYDSTTTDMVAQQYSFFGTLSRGSDADHGNYLKISGITNTSDAFWVRPYESTGDNRNQSKDISGYKQVVFFVKTSIDAKIEIKNGAWANVTEIDVTADAWTQVTINACENMKHLIDLSPAIWGAHATAFDFYVSSMYGSGLDPYAGMEKVFDVAEKEYTPLNWTMNDAATESSATISHGYTDSKYGEYCLIDVAKSAKSDAVWVKPSESVSLSDYSKVVFYIYSNQTMSSLQVRKESYELLVQPYAVSAGWNRVEVDLSSATNPTTTDIGIAYWSHATNLVWKITSIYGVKSA